jgi:hypothetical protein
MIGNDDMPISTLSPLPAVEKLMPISADLIRRLSVEQYHAMIRASILTVRELLL